MVQLNPVPVSGAQKNISTIWQKFFTEIAVQMVIVQQLGVKIVPFMIKEWNLGHLQLISF